jgi:hypothetical protein
MRDLFKLTRIGVFGMALLGAGACVSDQADEDTRLALAESASEQAVSCSPSSYQWNYFRTSSGKACVYGAFTTTCANQISVNIAEKTTWGGATNRIAGSGYRPSSGATTGRLCAYACLDNPNTGYYYKIDLWDLNGVKQSQDWVVGNSIPDPQQYSSSWVTYTSSSYPTGCTLSPSIPN